MKQSENPTRPRPLPVVTGQASVLLALSANVGAYHSNNDLVKLHSSSIGR